MELDHLVVGSTGIGEENRSIAAGQTCSVAPLAVANPSSIRNCRIELEVLRCAVSVPQPYSIAPRAPFRSAGARN